MQREVRKPLHVEKLEQTGKKTLTGPEKDRNTERMDEKKTQEEKPISKELQVFPCSDAEVLKAEV